MTFTEPNGDKVVVNVAEISTIEAKKLPASNGNPPNVFRVQGAVLTMRNTQRITVKDSLESIIGTFENG